MGAVIGIDLGTTNTAVAVVQDGRPRVLEDSRGYRVIPSCIAVKESGRFVVGHAAKSMILTDPERTVYAVKRVLGRAFDTPEVNSVHSRVAYRLERGDDGFARVLLGQRVMTPTEVIAVVLRVARETAESVLQEPVSDAVVTVPAYFNHRQRAATLEAARLAGLKCERLLNEPTAAALAYGQRLSDDKVVLVFDLGGGTFDISILHMSNGVYEVLATLGDTFLGGDDFDSRVVEHLASVFASETGMDIRDDKTAMQRLKEAAERAKCELSFSDAASVFISRLAQNSSLDLVISRSGLEGLVEDLVQRTLALARQAVIDAGLGIDAIDEVILVGGQTRMPRIRQGIEEVFGKKPSASVHPEEVVALGAAVHAESLVNPKVDAPLLIDVTPFDLGIDSAGGSFSVLIERNSKVPTARMRTFTTVVDNQEAVRISVRQGQSKRAVENEFLGEFVLSDLPQAPRMEPKLDVSFRIDASGMLQVSAVERSARDNREVVIQEFPLVREQREGASDGEDFERWEDETTEILPPVLMRTGVLGWLERMKFWKALGP